MRVNPGNNHEPTTPDRDICPVTGWPIVRHPEWTDVELDDGYRVSVEVIGGHIVRSVPHGFATAAGVARVNELHRDAIDREIGPGAAHVHVADYSGFEGASAEARRLFAEDLRTRSGIAAVVFYNVSPLFRIAIKLGRRFAGLHIPIEIASDHASAMRRAAGILADEGIEDIPTPAPDRPPPGHQPETGSLDLDGYHARYTIIDGHIVHGRSSGYLGLLDMERHLEFENMVLSSLDRSRGRPVLVVDVSELDGVSAAARRLYVTTLRTRQRVRPIGLYVCYGVHPMIRNAINISRPLLPFRIRFARDEATALELARRKPADDDGAVGRIRSWLFPPDPATATAEPTHIDDLLRLLSNIDWESDGPVDAGWQHPPDHPLAPVIDAIELIKADVDELFRARRQTEEALRASEERYRNILDSIVDGYYEIDLEGRLLFCNDPLLRIFGFDRREISTVDVLTLMDDDNRRAAVDTFRRVHETGAPATTTDWEMRRKDGGPVNVETSISLVTDGDGEAIGFRGIIRDITERVRTAREKEDLEVQLQRSQRMEAIGTLAGGIAHNFNNLLMGIQGNISLLTRDVPADTAHAQRLATIEALVDGGSKLTSQLLGYARSGRVEVRIVDLNDIALETAETFSLTRREYRVHSELADRTLPVEVDPTQIEQALLNLLINAADAMPRGGDIFLSSRLADHTEIASAEHEVREGRHAMLSVRDTGHGMDPETIERCFEPFFTTKGMTGGTGLGLASTYGIIRAHGGRIRVESVVGEGTTFTLSFPVAGRDPDAAGAPRPTPVEGEGTILVVEDDPAVLDACSEMLTLLHYTPICAGSGEAAVDIFERRRGEIDLVVLDLILSDLNGGEVFDRIRAIDPDTRVLLASGYSVDGEAAGILDRGCDDFIQKPFTIEQLSLKLESLLGRR